jgi:hypothetical protein
MQEFTDLCAWQEDITDYTEPTGDFIKDAGVALMIIAERLVRALCEQADIEIQD